MEIDVLLNELNWIQAQSISEIYEQESRRFSRGLSEEQEAKAKW